MKMKIKNNFKLLCNFLQIHITMIKGCPKEVGQSFKKIAERFKGE